MVVSELVVEKDAHGIILCERVSCYLPLLRVFDVFAWPAKPADVRGIAYS